MELSVFALKVFVLFIPGFFAYFTVTQLSVLPKHKLSEKIFYTFIFSFVAYFFYYVIIFDINYFLERGFEFHFPNVIQNRSQPLVFTELLFTSISGIYLGATISVLVNNKYLHKLTQKLGLTEKFGDLDVRDYILNSSETEWLIVRDFDTKMTYEGWIYAFSEAPDERDELLLRDVYMYDLETGEPLASAPGLYLAKDREHLHLEFPDLEYVEREALGTQFEDQEEDV